MKLLKWLARRLYKPRSPEEKAASIRFYLAVQDVEARREALRIKLCLKSSTTHLLG